MFRTRFSLAKKEKVAGTPLKIALFNFSLKAPSRFKYKSRSSRVLETVIFVRVASCANAAAWHRNSIPNTSAHAICFLNDNAIYLHECPNPDKPGLSIDYSFENDSIIITCCQIKPAKGLSYCSNTNVRSSEYLPDGTLISHRTSHYWRSFHQSEQLKQTLQAGFGLRSRQDLHRFIVFINIGNRIKWQVILPSWGQGLRK